MMQMLEILMKNKMQQIPQQMMSQLEQQLKRMDPQAFKRYQEAKQNNNPNDLLNETINGFNPQQKQQGEQMMGMFNNKG